VREARAGGRAGAGMAFTAAAQPLGAENYYTSARCEAAPRQAHVTARQQTETATLNRALKLSVYVSTRYSTSTRQSIEQ